MQGRLSFKEGSQKEITVISVLVKQGKEKVFTSYYSAVQRLHRLLKGLTDTLSKAMQK